MKKTGHSRAYLAVEFAVLYAALPLLYFYKVVPVHIIPVLVVAAMGCLAALLRDPEFDRRKLWNAAAAGKHILPIAGMWVVASVLLTLYLVHAHPEVILFLPRRMPALWILIMILYPLLSVYPQELIYRAFLFHRYRTLLTSAPARILVSALVFGFAHIVFGNYIALALTLFGGLFFAVTYHLSGSLAAVWLEHALYGWYIFTSGFGLFFYLGTMRAAQRMLGV